MEAPYELPSLGRLLPFSNMLTVSPIRKTDLGRYIVSTVLIDDPELLPIYETVIFNASYISHPDKINGKTMQCAFHMTAMKMHDDAVSLAKVEITLNDENERCKRLYKSFSQMIKVYGRST